MQPANQKPGKPDKLSQGAHKKTSYPRVNSPPLCRGLFSNLFIGYQDTLLIINSPLLIIIPGIHSLTCLVMTRSLDIYIKPCSILLKIISPLIITLYLFFHCTFVLLSTSPYVKIYQFRDYFMLIMSNQHGSGLSLHQCHA